MTQRIEQTILIQAPPFTVWDTLTNPNLMKQWMGEPAMEIEVITDWQVGHPIVIQGFHHRKFENRGTVWQFEPTRVLQYDYVSSISALADKPENHTLLEFRLTPVNNQTVLTLTISNFPTESIFKHVHFYWKTTMDLLKKWIETSITQEE
jgi:uncharacterized protein YndB with AHSA1/START domain